MTKLAKLLYLLGLGLLLVAILPATATEGNAMTNPASSQNPLPYRTVEVIADESKTVQYLDELGATELREPQKQHLSRKALSGRPLLFQVPVEKMSLLLAQPDLKFKVKDSYHKIGFSGIEFYPAAGEPPIPDNLRQTKREGYQLWLLQFQYHQRMEVREWLHTHNIPIVRIAGPVGFVVWVSAKELAELEAQVNPNGPLVWTGPYHPYYKPESELREKMLQPSEATIDIAVDLYHHVTVDTTLAKLEALAVSGEIYMRFDGSSANHTSFRALKIKEKDLAQIAAWRDTVFISLYDQPTLRDEQQNQIVAGNITVTTGSNIIPSGPGYLRWLTTDKGFSTIGANYPLVAIVDSGIDNGTILPNHPDFYSTSNNSKVLSVSSCTQNSTTNDKNGHGSLVASIMAGYNNSTDPISQDGSGYKRGLGVSPFGQMLNIKIIRDDTEALDLQSCPNRYSDVLAKARLYSVKITNNSWGSTRFSYGQISQLYDSQTRSQNNLDNEMLHIFAAGNQGETGLRTIETQGSAKNVLAIGATSLPRSPNVEDGCGFTSTLNADDISSSSSRGPTLDGRAKPDLVAPGIHIQGAASRDNNFSGAGVCGLLPSRRYYPANQNLYTWATGTSFAVPAVSGAAQLLYN